MNRDPFQILGISENATLEEAKEAHRRLAKKYHPDINPDQGSTKKMSEINVAFDEVLNILENRANYHNDNASNYQERKSNNTNYHKDFDKEQSTPNDTYNSSNYTQRNQNSNHNRRRSGPRRTCAYDEIFNTSSTVQDNRFAKSQYYDASEHFIKVFFIVLGIIVISILVGLTVSSVIEKNNGSRIPRIITSAPAKKLPAATEKLKASQSKQSSSNSGGFWKTIGNLLGKLFVFLPT